eukprot:4584587-Prymnesium_polylepis.1
MPLTSEKTRSDGADDGSIAKQMRAAFAQAGKVGLLTRHHLSRPSVKVVTSERSKPVHVAAATRYTGSSLIISVRDEVVRADGHDGRHLLDEHLGH